jgi:hypothetical protein
MTVMTWKRSVSADASTRDSNGKEKLTARDLPLAFSQWSLGYGVYHLDADPRLTVVPRSESTELREHASSPRRPPLW